MRGVLRWLIVGAGAASAGIGKPMETAAHSQAAKRVLVIRVGHLGDSVLATTVIEPLRAAFGTDVLIDFAAGPGVNAVVLGLDRRINRVFPISRRRLHWRFNADKKTLRRHALGRPYDLVLNLECGDECNDFARFVPSRTYHGRPGIRHEHAFDRHCVDTEKRIYRDLLGADVTDAAEPELRLANVADLQGQGFVLLNPGFAGLAEPGYRSHRAWPAEHWAGLASLIAERMGVEVHVNGTANERPFLEPLLDQPGIKSLVGSSIEELVAAARTAACVVSVDTGTMHLAAALGTPVVALFGPTIPALTGPYSKSSPYRVLTSGIDCQPCDRTPAQKRCTFNQCMAELTPGSVFEAMQELLTSPSTTGDLPT